MCALRRVEDERAGPDALGILIPPARRTFLILRPRSLSWDLLLLRGPEGSTFREMSHDEASAAAHAVYRALRDWAAGGAGRVEAVSLPQGQGAWLRARVGPFVLLACARRPGQPYHPLVFADAHAAGAAACRLTAILCPPPGVEQEVYFNTRNFKSPP